MRAQLGQAARRSLRGFRRLLSLAIALVLVALVGLGALAWRLAQGPIELPWLVRRLEAAVNVEGATLSWSIGGAALAWEGFAAGLDRPLDIRVTGVAATARDGTPLVAIPEAHVALSMTELVRRRFVPRAIELHGARLRAHRTTAGAWRVDLAEAAGLDTAADAAPDVADIIARLARPPGADPDATLDQLRRLTIRDATLTLDDRQLDRHWTATGLALDLRREPAGGGRATLALDTRLGDQSARLAGTVALAPDGRTLDIQANLSALNPARLAAADPLFAALAPVDTPASLDASLTLDARLALRRAAATLRLGPGQLAIAHGKLPIAAAEIVARGDATAVTLERFSLDAAPPGRPVTRAQGSGALERGPEGYKLDLAIEVPRADIVDLPVLWPDGVAGRGAKPWLVENLTAGILTDLRVAITIEAPPDLSAVHVTHLSGGGDGRDATVHWLRPIPPIEQGTGRLEFVSPDVLDIRFASGRQGTVQITGGHMLIDGLSIRDQVSDIAVEMNGPVADIIAVLRHPRIRLLDRRPIEMRNPAGQAKGRLDITRLPLESWITFDDVNLKVAASLTGVHLGGTAAGRDIDRGQFELTASNDALSVAGTAAIAGISTKLQVDMDFRPNAPVIQTVTASGTAETAQIAALGLDAGDTIQGSVPLSLIWRTRRDNRGDIALKAGLDDATLSIPRLAFSKPRGRPAALEARIALDRDRIGAIERLTVKGEGIDATARVTFAGGKPAIIALDRLALGRETDIKGEIRAPAGAADPWRLTITGPSLDASAEFGRRDPTPATRGPAYIVDARLDRVVLGPGRQLAAVRFQADNDGLINRRLSLAARAGSGPFELAIAPGAQGRALTGKAADAGALLRALDLVEDMAGGTMTLSGRFDDSRPDHPLAGNAEIADFRMVKAPGLAKLLQAMTLYGVVEMMRGPGLGFAKLDAPFRLAGDRLELDDARAFNASLGMTAKGRADLATQRCDISGTIVPAYFFNSLLGGIPFLGKLFSPEKGGGLFAATYSMRGDCNDPVVTVNPLAALTPGFLRGLFGIFDGPPGAPPPSREGSNPAR